MCGLEIKEFLMVTRVPCDLPNAFLSRVKDKETIFLITGSNVFGFFNFVNVDYRTGTKWIPVLENTNCIPRGVSIISAEDTDLLSEHGNAPHEIHVHIKCSNESVKYRTDDCKYIKSFDYYTKILIIMQICYYATNKTNIADVLVRLAHRKHNQ